MFGSKDRKKEIADENTHILVATCTPPGHFEIVDSISDFASATAGFDGVVRTQDAFRLLKNKLRAAAIELGGDAVIECQFSQRGAHSGGLAAVQVVELWGFGTVVRAKASPA